MEDEKNVTLSDPRERCLTLCKSKFDLNNKDIGLDACAHFYTKKSTSGDKNCTQLIHLLCSYKEILKIYHIKNMHAI